MKKIVLLALVGLALTACGNSKTESADQPDLTKAYQLCVKHADIGVKGRIKQPSPDEISIEGAADKADFAALGCVFAELDTPKSLMADIGVATSQSGSDSLDAGGLHYAWSIQVDGIYTSYPALHMSITQS
jgi:hypothetical protein